MSGSADAMRVVVDAPARVHFGMLDLGGTLGRRFGGIGAAICPPGLQVSAAHARHVAVAVAPDAELSDMALAQETVAAARATAATAAGRLLAHHHVDGGAAITLHRLLPSHYGLGSGTQLALATGRAVAKLHGLPDDAVGLARIVGRARRSGVGTYAFEHGGFIVEGGCRPDVDRPAPLLARLPVPANWRCVLALPSSTPGVSGDAERAAFAALPQPPVHEAERVAHLVLMALLPALADRDFAAFGAALTEIQLYNGRWFAPAQGGPFAPGASTALLETLMSWGASGVGQSSWGPAVYAIAPDPDSSAALGRQIRAAFHSAVVYDAAFSATGAQTSWVTG